MSDELKTLKDFEVRVIDQVDSKPVKHTKLIDADVLRAEAIKWVQFWLDDKALKDPADKLQRGMQLQLAIEAFIKFFNLTKEDLK